jgi:hypothetical protein
VVAAREGLVDVRLRCAEAAARSRDDAVLRLDADGYRTDSTPSKRSIRQAQKS